MPTRLSSRLTFVQKVVVPAAGGTLTAAAVASVFPLLLDPSLPSAAVGAAIAAVALPAVFTALAFAESRKLKQVLADDRGLLVSNYRREIRVPYDGIAEAFERTRHGNGHVVVRTRRPTAFGPEIRILLPFRFVLRRPVRGEHPVVLFLRSRGVPVVEPGQRR